MAAGGFGMMNRLGYARPNATTANAQQPNNEMQAAMFPHYAPALPKGWWFGFRAGWVAVAVGGYAVFRLLDRRNRALFVAALLGAVGALSFLAWDTTRTIAMLLPLLADASAHRRPARSTASARPTRTRAMPSSPEKW